jgi:hypothetical protein
VQCMFCLTFYRQAEGKMISTLIRRTKNIWLQIWLFLRSAPSIGWWWLEWVGLKGWPKVDRKLMNSRANGIKCTGVSHVRALQLDFLQWNELLTKLKFDWSFFYWKFLVPKRTLIS